MSLSISGFSSLAFGSVVVICSCLISDAAMLPNIARRWELVLLSLRPALRWRMSTLLDPSVGGPDQYKTRSEEHTSELQSLMRISYAVFCLKNKKKKQVNDSVSCHEQVRTTHKE